MDSSLITKKFIISSKYMPLLLGLFSFIVLVFSSGCGNPSNGEPSPLKKGFLSPPQSAKPGVYWYFLDGNQNRKQMTQDLESMARVGIAKVIFLEVDLGLPKGPVKFFSEKWQDNFKHAVNTANRLGMELILGTGPGWAGSGGPWVKAEDSMQHIASNTLNVVGPSKFKMKLAVPSPLKPNHFHGMNEKLISAREHWYKDIAVLAFPSVNGDFAIDKFELKTLKETQPYSIWKHVPRFIKMPLSFIEPEKNQTVSSSRVIDLSEKMTVDGMLEWNVPKGNWTIMRFVSRSTGQTSRPAPSQGHGFETDKFSSEAFLRHWSNFQAKLLNKVKPGRNGKGWTGIHLDSWEMSSQNWTPLFREKFISSRGYDPKVFYPVFGGKIIDSVEKTERFLWDFRKVAQELVINNYANTIKEKAHKHGMTYSNQPYDMNPAGDFDLGAVADIPSCEFWDHRNSNLVDTLYSCIEATSIGHILNKKIISAEAFTSILPNRFHSYPGQMKNQTDWAFAMGINNIIFHTFPHQPLGNNFKPGMAMGPHGSNWHRHQTWWEMLPAYHSYISRASYLLQQGTAVADILYVIPEGVPHIFSPPTSALGGTSVMKYKRGYSFDAVSLEALIRLAEVRDGKIVFPGGSSYSLVILPKLDRITVKALNKLENLVQMGARIIGNPPHKSPSLVNFPNNDRQVLKTVMRLWGGKRPPKHYRTRHFGKGTIFWGENLYRKQLANNNFYPNYETTKSILQSLGVSEDFRSSTHPIRFSHRKLANTDIYFVSNPTNKKLETLGLFRVKNKVPELWHPEKGIIRSLPLYSPQNDKIKVPLKFHPFESYFIVFSEKSTSEQNAKSNFPIFQTAAQLKGPWEVIFPRTNGKMTKKEFEILRDWRNFKDPEIRYYSGIAEYKKVFDMPTTFNKNNDYFLDLGQFYEMAEVKLNGFKLDTVWTAPPRVNLSKKLKQKNNILRIKIANSWENRLIGDKTLATEARSSSKWSSGLLAGNSYESGANSFTTYSKSVYPAIKHFETKAVLQPSGLIGPLRIIRKVVLNPQ